MTAQPSPTNREVEACPICGARAWRPLFESRSFTIARCNACQLVRTLGVEDDGVTTYPHFDQRETAVVKLMRFAVTQLLRERASIVGKVAGKGSRLLDVGCGSGAFARMMSERGYEAVGVEPFSLGRPVDEPHLRLIRAEFADVRDEIGKFDVITMWHVLEHIPSPKDLLEGVLSVLNDDGVLVVSVPNFASWQSRVFKGGWFHLDPPRHITHFDRTTLHSLLEGMNLEIFEERTFHVEYGPVGWLQSAFNRILRPNFLFEFVKDRGALADVPLHETALNLLASGAAGALLAGPAFAVEAAAGAMGSGSVLTACVRRRRSGAR
jgi:2-polyprenyl-3-methyl-5-hydroxy-6-metoxy-1,4-benzoquinol methylase